MVARFKVGKSYYDSDRRFDPITITKRTKKTIWVTNGRTSWMMRIRGGVSCPEFAIDSSLLKSYRAKFMYLADNETH